MYQTSKSFDKKVFIIKKNNLQLSLGKKNIMETLVEEQDSASVVVSQSGGEQTASSGGQVDVPTRTSSATAQVRANGTVVLTSPAQVKHVVTSAASNTQAIAVPQPGGAVSIVHVAIPSQPVHVQSVIQPGPNQQSVIQAPGGTTLQSVQLSKNVILLNKVSGQGSVIHSTDGETGVHPVQLISAKPQSEVETITSTIASPEDSKKRREILARRPSYRKIFNDLSSAEAQGAVVNLANASGDAKDETSASSVGTDGSNQESDSTSGGSTTITVAGTQYATTGILKVVSASPLQLATATQDGGIQGLQTLTMTSAGNGTAGTIVQYAQGQDGQQFFVPVTVSAADLQAYQIRATGNSSATALSQGVVVAPPSTIQTIQTPQQLAEEASRKREMRLLKNREAAKECRRKKKEYIKCLENRVAVLENQNKALIEELKSLKELYCQKNE